MGVSVALASGPAFDSHTDYQTGDEPISICAADFNGDGNPDLAVADFGWGRISILLGNGKGAFAAPVNYVVGNAAWSICAADFDGDGMPDLAVADIGSGFISILRNNGNGTFATAVNYTVGEGPSSVSAVDVDGDGKPDLAVANDRSNSISILRNNGIGTFAAAVDYSVGDHPHSVCCADLDGDGKLDLAVANYSNNVSVLRNNGNGTFAGAVNYAAGYDPTSVCAADFDGDGKQDLAVADFGYQNVSILRNNGDGSFAVAVNYSVGVAPNSICASDFDRDGKTDLAVANSGSNTLSVLINNGDGSFASALNYSVGNNPLSVWAADFDKDGRQDLAVANEHSNTVSILLNRRGVPKTIRVPGDFPTIKMAIDSSIDGDTVLVADGVYSGSGNTNLVINKDVLVVSQNGPDHTTLDAAAGPNLMRRIIAAMSEGEVRGFSLTNGYMVYFNEVPSYGGAACIGGTATMRNCYFSNNSADFGGAVSMGQGARLVSCKIEDNLAVRSYPGGGLAGGMYVIGDSVVVDSCTFSLNQAEGLDITAAWVKGSATLRNCLFERHTGFALCFGLFQDIDKVTVSHCTFSMNSAALRGLGYGNPVVIADCLLSYSGGIGDLSSSVTCTDVYPDPGGNWPSAPDGNGNMSAAPLFCDTVNGDFRVKSSSPCLPANNSCGVQIGAFGQGCVNVAPVITAFDTVSINEDARFVYYATATDPDGPSLTWSFINRPSWLASNADSIYGTPHYPVHDTSFSVIASDGFLADTLVVNIAVHQLTPEVRLLRVDSDTLNLHAINAAPQFTWHYYDPTGSSPQTQFVVAVGTDRDWTYAEMWNPAPFTSPDSLVQYAGITLVRGQTYYLRVKAYNGSRWSPWKNSAFRVNSIPSIPVAKQPVNDQVVGSTPMLWVTDATDAEGDPLFYDFDGYHDSACANGPAISLVKIAGTADSTGGHTVSALSENCRYHWRSRSFDGYEYSDWSTYSTFVVDGTPEPPSAVTLINPPTSDGKPTFTLLPSLYWTAATDPDPLDTVRYRVELSLSSNFSLVFAKDSLLADSFKVLDSLQFGTHYWWRVSSRDKTNLVTMCQVPSNFWTWALGDVNSSHMTDLGDLSMYVSYLTGAGATISPKMVGDLNADCKIDLADLSRLVNYLTGGGAQMMPGCEGPGVFSSDSVHVVTGKMKFEASRANSVGLMK